jgi:hypothetical protein
VSTPDIRKALEAIANAMDVMSDKPDRLICPDVWRSLKCEALIADARAALAAQGQAPQPVPAFKGWQINHARAKPDEVGVWEVGFLDDQDETFSPIVTVDTGLYYAETHAEPMARAILAWLAGASPQAAVPAEPTTAMVTAGALALHHVSIGEFDATDDEVRAVWNAMYAARPQAQPTPTDTPT